jgi:hypothetical protein
MLIGLILFSLIFTIGLVVKMAMKPSVTINALALVVSVVGINIHVGATFYLSRIVLILFFVSLLLNQFKSNIKLIWFQIPLLSMLVQLVSVLFSDRISEGLRQLFIYLSLFAIFLIIIIVSKDSKTITKAIIYYLFMGIVQGLYGMYQVIGGVKGWPTYQTLMAGIPMANDRTVDGYFYTGAYSAFRAIGFFSSDVSHYAGYMAGILIISLSMIANNKKQIFPYLVFAIGGAGLLFSLSRSGIIAFLLFGIPSLLILLRKADIIPKIKIKSIIFFLLVSIVIGGIGTIIFNNNDDVQNPFIILTSRFENILDANSSQSESMSDHFLTRQLGLDAFMASPIIGVGLGVNAAPWHSENLNAEWAGSHSYHIDMLGQIGLIGLLLEWLLMGFIIWYMLKGLKVKEASNYNKAMLCGLLSAYITIILGNFLYYYYLNDFVWFIMGSGVALSHTIIQENKLFNNFSLHANKE